MNLHYSAVLRGADPEPRLEHHADLDLPGWPTEIAFQHEAREMLRAPHAAIHGYLAPSLRAELSSLARRTRALVVANGDVFSCTHNLGLTSSLAFVVVSATTQREGRTGLSLILSYDALGLPSDDIERAERDIGASRFFFELGRILAR